MKHKYLTLTISFFLLLSCNKTNTSTLGLYTENSPVQGRSQLNFISNNLVVHTETASSYSDTFLYTISSDKISLSPKWVSNATAQQLDFKRIDNNTFQIENLYLSIPEAPKSYMIFKK